MIDKIGLGIGILGLAIFVGLLVWGAYKAKKLDNYKYVIQFSKAVGIANLIESYWQMVILHKTWIGVMHIIFFGILYCLIPSLKFSQNWRNEKLK